MCDISVQQTSTRAGTAAGLVNAHGRGCCCYDAMATAPWEASDELNEFPPQLKWSSRRQSGLSQCRGTYSRHGDSGRGLPATVHGHTQPGVSASLGASRVMTFEEISHTSVRLCSEKHQHPVCSPLAETKWGGVVIFYFFVSGCIVILTDNLLDPFALFTGSQWQREPQPGC